MFQRQQHDDNDGMIIFMSPLIIDAVAWLLRRVRDSGVGWPLLAEIFATQNAPRPTSSGCRTLLKSPSCPGSCKPFLSRPEPFTQDVRQHLKAQGVHIDDEQLRGDA